MKNAAIVHGSYGTATENWFPWLASELDSKGVRTSVPTLPTPDGQTLEGWITSFASQAGTPGPETVLIGHSMGSGFIVRLLERLSSPVAGCVLTSSFMHLLDNEEFDVVNRSFVEGPVDWDRCRVNAGDVVVYHGSNDPYVPVEFGREVADRLGGTFVIVENGGHLNASAGLLEFPAVLASVEAILDPIQD